MDPLIDNDAEYQRLDAIHQEAVREYDAGLSQGCAQVLRDGQSAPAWTLDEFGEAKARLIRVYDTLHAKLCRMAALRGMPEPQRIGPVG